MQLPNLQLTELLIAIIQFIGTPILFYIAAIVRRTNKRNKLQGFKHEALVYSIQENLSNNGFTKDYYNKLNQLIKEHNFVWKEK